jgi:Concanavalin A-like lectin/glucanases superfamily
MTNHPWAYWKFEETNDTFFQSMQAYDYSGHNFDATYGNSADGSTATGCKDGGESLPNLGPGGSDKYAGFPLNNMCAKPSPNHANGYLTVPPLNLKTNTVTFTMWIKPNVATLPKSTGLFMNRNGNDGAGIGFGTTTNGSSTPCLAYTWNTNSSATVGWNSGLFPVAGVWNFVACTITPSNTVMYLYYINGNTTNLFRAVNSGSTNAVEAFSGGTTWMGGDNGNNGLNFNGWIDEVAIFTNSLSENTIQTLFLYAIGLTNGVAPVVQAQPTNAAVFQGQTLQMTAYASGIPSPNYQWQYYNGSAWANLGSSLFTNGLPSRMTTNGTFYYQNYTNPSIMLDFRAVAFNNSGTNYSNPAFVTYVPVANWNQGLWTVNFCVPSTQNGGPGTPYVGPGVLATINTEWTTNVYAYYWNALSGGNLQNTTSLRDDGVTPSGINVSTTNDYIGTFSSGAPCNNLLLDQYCQIADTNNGMNFFFTGVPKGVYNLALYGCTASYANRGVGFTVITNGVSAGTQWVTNSLWNAADLLFTPYDNTAVFTNLVVTSGTLQVNAAIALATPAYTNSQEADFNGAQLQMLTPGPNISSLTHSGTNFVLTYAGGILLSSTNVVGPTWVTNFGNPYTIIPTGQMRFFKVYTNKFP